MPRTTRRPISGRASPACRTARIIRIPTADNFWRMGDTGPCGPCSEIFYDHGEQFPGGPPGSPDEDGDRFIEIWNLVFMQFEEGPPGTRVPLPRPSIDTGLGLERFAAILQGKHDNYDTDTLRALILASAEATGTDPDGAAPDRPPRGRRPSARDRVPDRRRRAALATRAAATCCAGSCAAPCATCTMMGTREPVFHKLVPALVRQMGAAYPELAARRAADLRDHAAGGRPLQGDAGARPRPARRGDRAARRRARRCPARSRSGSTTPTASRST